ncbi:MAG: SufD family Fe-S cluster assembly protein, partial [Collinsella sp.]|nr:SufD family Fe-S cluster assembly protein [Collinsella sp.]
MKQTINTAATTLEQVNAMPAATWGWLKMNQTKLELSDELAAAPAEAIEVEGLDEQIHGAAEAFDTAMEAMAERFPERRASAPGDAADRARITP